MATKSSKSTSSQYDFNQASTDSLQELLDSIDHKTFANKLKQYIQLNVLTNNQYDLLLKVAVECTKESQKK